MVLYTLPFSSAFLRVLHCFAWGLIFPCYWLLDRLLASFLVTTYEKRQRSEDPCYFLAFCILISTPVYLVLLVASLPFAFLGFLIWAPLQAVRHPYIYSKRGRPDKNRAEQGTAGTPVGEWKAQGKSFCFCTANACLLPDSLARFNNLSDTQGRAREVGKRIRNGASRPQIKIYIDSPTNTSISAASFSSLISPQGGGEGPQRVAGVRRTSSLEYKVESNGEAEKEQEEGGNRDEECVPLNDCPSGVQISISAPEPEGEEDQKGQAANHKPKEGDSGSLDSRTASRESLVKFHVADGTLSNNKLTYHTSVLKKASARKRRHGDDSFDHEISAFFPANLDFLCLQEVFDKRAAGKLKRQLHRYFQYILYDVGRYAWKGCSRFKFLNSGLLLASRYPILDASYHCYPNGRGEDALAAKGALFVKVQVGSTPQDQRIVGYISCTHLHALEGDAAIRCEQLDLLLEWLAEFRKSTSHPSGGQGPEDQVAFDVILGDLNFDNSSSEDKLEQQHVLFTHYKDPCRLGAGEEKPWAVGTLLNPTGLYDEEVSSPESLQKVMENEEGRKEYLVYPTSKNHCSSQKGRKIPLKGSGRRVDYILYTEEGLQQDWKVDVEEYSFVTQLAGLTDHLAVSMRLTVSTGEEEP
uniref:Sphingomyelin phosphodiesterase 3 n=1 Tax=Lepisosteus oculatus TaxID=7918 RepID=W5M6U4_LEPOC|nr:PREDICTED: sphingomyelin phosphodiesterase 3 [Lepisosteus oculatus]XP_015223708.1 PREDICTED: sphingomyelin phosphodiesterase 3 [Lepisosteus oculatus]